MRLGQNRVRQQCEFHLSLFEPCLAKIGGCELSAAQPRCRQIGFPEARTTEARASQIRTLQIGSAEIGAVEAGVSYPSPPQICRNEVHVRKIGVPQIGARALLPIGLEIAAVRVQDAGQIGATGYGLVRNHAPMLDHLRINHSTLPILPHNLAECSREHHIC
jgi:hypothetical protein